MTEKQLNIIIKIIAPILIFVAILFAFVDIADLRIKVTNDGYVTSILTLVAILLYFSALMFQIKEYKLQIVELKKSVEAQTVSSKALEEQKKILLEQSFTNLIFNLMADFKQFKRERDIYVLLDEIKEKFQGTFALTWKKLSDEKRLNIKELNESFAIEVDSIFSTYILKFDNVELFRQYLQFVFNILDIIDENRHNFTKDYYTSTFYIQLKDDELLLIILSDLVNFGLPHYKKIEWKNHHTEKLISWLNTYKEQNINFNKMDRAILTNKFIEMKKAMA